MISFKQTLTVFTLLLAAQISFGQVTLYSEDFTGQAGKGVVGPASPLTYDVTGVTWSIDTITVVLTSTGDYFKVNALEKFEGVNLDGEAIWYSPSVDVSSVTYVNLSVDLEEVGDLESTDYIKIYYVLDGGSETEFETNGNNSDDFNNLVATHKYLSGSTIQIVIKMKNNAGSESIFFDNITVIENLTNAPTVGDVLLTEYARYTTSTHSYLELYNTTSTDIHLAGSKIISSGSNAAVYDFDSDIPGTNIVPANGFLILNRDISKATFETTWGVTLDSMDADVNYNRTGVSAFGNNNLFVLKTGGTTGVDDGTLIDQTSENATALGKRVFQLPKGYWSGNEDDASLYAIPGGFYNYENLNYINMAYSDGAWHAETGYAFSEPSASTGTAGAVVVRGDATFTDGTQLGILGVWPNAGTSISTEIITVNSGIYLAHNASLSITSTGSVTCAGQINVTKEGYNSSNDYNAWGTPFSTLLRFDSVFTDHNDCDFYAFEASNQVWKYDYTVGSTITCGGNDYTVATSYIIESPEGTPDGNFDVGRGYFIVGNTNNAYDFRFESGGTLNNGNITANIYGSSATKTSGSNDWNLISNPYPSAISVNTFLTTNNSIISNALYLYNPGTGIDSNTSYTTYNSTDGANMASCQGFYVDASTLTDGLIGTVSFTNAMRTNQNNDFRSFDSFTGVYLNVTDTKHVTDQTRLYFDRDCEDGRDRKFDAIKMENTGFNFASKLGDEKMVFNGLKELTTETKIVPLYFQTNEKSIFNISIDSLLGDLSNKDILLEDRFMRKFHDLKGQDYVFASDDKEWNNRFFIHIVEQKTNDNAGSGTITGVEDIDDNTVKVFQTGEDIVVSSSNEEITHVELIAISGRKISSDKVKGTLYTTNASRLANGVYLVQYFLANGTTETRKIVIQ